MAFSYDPSGLNEPLNQLRFLVQDTSATGSLLDDAEITFTYEQNGNIYKAAAALCRVIVARLSLQMDFDDEGMKFEMKDRAKYFAELARTYDEKAETLDTPTAGGSTGLSLPKLPSFKPSFTRDLHRVE